MSKELARIPVPGTDRFIMATLVDGRPMVSLRHACEAIGLAVARQREKLQGKSWACGLLTVSQLPGESQAREYYMIDRRTFTMWLATVDSRRVAPEARPVIEAFQAEAADALDAYFNEGGAINPRASSSQINVLRGMLDQIEAAELAAARAEALAEQSRAVAQRTEARLDAIEGKHGWFSALAYARINGLPTDNAYLNKLGRRATPIARADGIEPSKVEHSLFGTVNSYPASVWDKAVDEMDTWRNA